MTDEDVVRNFGRIVGVGHINGPYANRGKKPVWVWQTGAFEDVQLIVSLFWGWLGERRKSRASELLKQYHVLGGALPIKAGSQSAQVCGCDSGANWKCLEHR